MIIIDKQFEEPLRNIIDSAEVYSDRLHIQNGQKPARSKKIDRDVSNLKQDIDEINHVAFTDDTIGMPYCYVDWKKQHKSKTSAYRDIALLYTRMEDPRSVVDHKLLNWLQSDTQAYERCVMAIHRGYHVPVMFNGLVNTPSK